MRDEKETSHKWVLKICLEAARNKPPLTINKNQDIAFENAIAEIFPHTKHTLCSWYISSKFPEILSALYTQYPDFGANFNDCFVQVVVIHGIHW